MKSVMLGQPLLPWLFPSSFLFFFFLLLPFFLLFPCPAGTASFQCLHPDAARGCRPSPRIVEGKSKAGVSPGMSPPAQLESGPPLKGMQCKEQACAILTPKQLGIPHLPPERAGEPRMQDRTQAEASSPPPAPWGIALVAPPRPAPVAQGLFSAVGPWSTARLQSLYEVGCIIT